MQGKIDTTTTLQLENQKEGYHFGGVGMNGRAMLSRVCRKVNSFVMCHDLRQNKIAILCVKRQLKVEVKLRTPLNHIRTLDKLRYVLAGS
jgi:hypothetical protein